MRIAICDDENIMHRALKEQLEAYARSRRIILLYDDYLNGLELIKSKYEYDIIFMDYQMNGIDGLETARKLRKKKVNSAIIFLTSYPKIVFDTFEVNAYRFLLKPIDREKLFNAMDNYRKSIADSRYILIKNKNENTRINIDDIIYIEAADKHCWIRTVNDSYLYKNTLALIEKQLPKDMFIRSHRTYLVGFKHIISHTTTEILFDNNEKAMISKLKLTPFKNAFTNYIKKNSLGGDKL